MSFRWALFLVFACVLVLSSSASKDKGAYVELVENTGSCADDCFTIYKVSAPDKDVILDNSSLFFDFKELPDQAKKDWKSIGSIKYVNYSFSNGYNLSDMIVGQESVPYACFVNGTNMTCHDYVPVFGRVYDWQGLGKGVKVKKGESVFVRVSGSKDASSRIDNILNLDLGDVVYSYDEYAEWNDFTSGAGVWFTFNFNSTIHNVEGNYTLQRSAGTEAYQVDRVGRAADSLLLSGAEKYTINKTFSIASTVSFCMHDVIQINGTTPTSTYFNLFYDGAAFTSFGLATGTTNRLMWYIRDSTDVGSSTNNSATSWQINDSKFHYYAFCRAGSRGLMYADGLLTDNATIAETGLLNFGTIANNYVGYDGGTKLIKGTLDEFWLSPLKTSSEIMSLNTSLFQASVVTVNSNVTIPATPGFGNSVFARINCTTNSGFVDRVNATLTLPNTTVVSLGSNLTFDANGVWNSSSFIIGNLGWHNITSYCVDSNGNVGSSLLNFNVTNVAPVLRLNRTLYSNGSSPSLFFVGGNQSVLLSVNVTDADGFVNVMNATVTLPNSSIILLSNFSSCLNNECNSSSFNTGIFGKYNVSVSAYDNVGVSVWSNWSFFVGDQALSFGNHAFSPVSPYLNDNVTVQVNLSSLSSGLANVTALGVYPNGSVISRMNSQLMNCSEYSLGLFECNVSLSFLAIEQGIYNLNFTATSLLGNTSVLRSSFDITDGFRYTPSSVSASMTNSGYNLSFNMTFWDSNPIVTPVLINLSFVLDSEKDSAVNPDFDMNISFAGVQYDKNVSFYLNNSFNLSNESLTASVNIYNINLSLANYTRNGTLFVDRVWQDGSVNRSNVSITYAVHPPAGEFSWLTSNNLSCTALLCTRIINLNEGAVSGVSFNINNTGANNITNIGAFLQSSFPASWGSVAVSVQNLSVGQVGVVTVMVTPPSGSGGTTGEGQVFVRGIGDGFGTNISGIAPVIPYVIVNSIDVVAPANGGGGGGGGAAPVVVVGLDNESLFQVKSESNSNFYDLFVSEGETVTRSVFVKNLQVQKSIDLSVSCQKGTSLDPCSMVKFSQDSLSLIPFEEKKVTFTYSVPSGLDKTYFEVLVVDGAKHEGVLKVFVTESVFALFSPRNWGKGIGSLLSFLFGKSSVSDGLYIPRIVFFLFPLLVGAVCFLLWKKPFVSVIVGGGSFVVVVLLLVAGVL